MTQIPENPADIDPHAPRRIALSFIAGALLGAAAGLIGVGLAFAGGFIISALSTALGVAGGEMRIPMLMYAFAFDVKLAGTISLIASVPTVAGGALTYRHFGYFSRPARWIARTMSLGSILGVLAGSAFLPRVDAHVLKGLLGVTVVLAALGLVAGRERHSPPL